MSDMNLTTLRTTITDSDPHSWHRISDGPFFHSKSYYGDDNYQPEHYYRAVLADDLDVSIEWGMPTRDGEDEPAHIWATTAAFPDQSVHSFWIDVFYAGTLVDRARAYSVDGGRAYLPRYDQRRTDDGGEDMSTAVWDVTVAEWDDTLARLVSNLSGLREYDSHVKRAGLRRA